MCECFLCQNKAPSGLNGSYTKIMNALDTKLANGKKLSHDLNVIFKTFKRENCAQQD